MEILAGGGEVIHPGTPIDMDTFQRLPDSELAALVREAGSQVCIFPINGTRRWFTFEHGSQNGEKLVGDYIEKSSEIHISLYRMLFDHGIDTLVTPTLGSDILLRGEEYMRKIGAEGLARLASGADFLAFYNEKDVRVHFYGDHRKRLKGTPYSYLSDIFDDVAEKTRKHSRYRLFFGVFAEDAAESIAKLSVDFFQKYGRIPDKNSLIELYYGETIPTATLFIGFGPFWVFDYPLLSTGTEDLYFTVSPTPYMKKQLLRAILYDHLYRRAIEEPDYSTLSAQEQNWLIDFYRLNSGNALGLGKLRSGIWIPEVSLKKPKA